MSIKPITDRTIIKLNLGIKFGLNKLDRMQFNYPLSKKDVETSKGKTVLTETV